MEGDSEATKLIEQTMREQWGYIENSEAVGDSEATKLIEQTVREQWSYSENSEEVGDSEATKLIEQTVSEQWGYSENSEATVRTVRQWETVRLQSWSNNFKCI